MEQPAQRVQQQRTLAILGSRTMQDKRAQCRSCKAIVSCKELTDAPRGQLKLAEGQTIAHYSDQALQVCSHGGQWSCAVSTGYMHGSQTTECDSKKAK